MELDIWSGDWGTPSVEYRSLQLLTLVKFSGANIQVNKTNNPFKTPNGHLPVFRQSKKSLYDFRTVLDHLNNKNYCPDLNLDQKQLADSYAYRTMIEEKLYPALQYLWWVDEKNYTQITRPWYANALPFPLNFYYPGHYRKENEQSVLSLYPELSNSEIETQIYKEAEKCLTCLSNRLGDADFFMGQHPTSLDAFAYGCLAPLLKAPLVSNVLQNYLKASSNLVRWIVRITQRYYAREVAEYETKQQKEAEKKTASELTTLRNNILAVIFTSCAMIGYAVYNRIFTFSTSHNRQNEDEEDEINENELQNE